MPEALLLADRIRNAIKIHSFASKREQTISAGVAMLMNNDSIDSHIELIYLSIKQKEAGRIESVHFNEPIL